MYSLASLVEYGDNKSQRYCMMCDMVGTLTKDLVLEIVTVDVFSPPCRAFTDMDLTSLKGDSKIAFLLSSKIALALHQQCFQMWR